MALCFSWETRSRPGIDIFGTFLYKIQRNRIRCYYLPVKFIKTPVNILGLQ